jgi:4,5-DOPA dioxygenase extradiol
MNALQDNAFTKSLARVAAELPGRPEAILVVSAHWETPGSFACTAALPETIHDFGGFPDALFAVEYPAPGAPEFAARAAALLSGGQASEKWGLDHGAWSVLRHLFPEADIPVFEVSIDSGKTLREQLELGRALSPLRNEGVLVLGSGNIVHNLARIRWNGATYDWAKSFDEWVRSKLDNGDAEALCDLDSAGEAARLSCPSLEHYSPLIYAMGAAGGGSGSLGRPAYTYEGFEHGSLSMRCVRWN